MLYNSWYATTFDVNEEHQLALAQRAKDWVSNCLLSTMLVFKGRKTDHAGLGDWEVDIEKFPNGLNPMIEKLTLWAWIFGIWVEPKWFNPNSDL